MRYDMLPLRSFLVIVFVLAMRHNTLFNCSALSWQPSITSTSANCLLQAVDQPGLDALSSWLQSQLPHDVKVGIGHQHGLLVSMSIHN